MSISAFIPVFNEEKRIETTLKTLQWCDEIIVLDKESTDRTAEIAKIFHGKVFNMPNSHAYDSSEFEYMLKYCSSEWVLIFTASDVIHPKLSFEIKRLTSMKDFAFDVIYVPYRRYILGIETKRSPWYTENAPMVIRKNKIEIRKNGVHNALYFNTTKKYKIKNSVEHCIFHLTHETVDGMMNRHIRYWRGEARGAVNESIMRGFIPVLKAFVRIFIFRKSLLLGWKGVMLSCAYISYFMMSFVFKWEKKYSEAGSNYNNIRQNILKEWEKLNS